MKLFATLPEDAQEDLLQHMSALHIERGGIIVAKDEFPDACSIILSGKADVLLNIDDQHPLSVLRADINIYGSRAWNCGGKTVQ